MSSIKEINHVAIVVDDIESALRFWRDGLGMKVTHVEDLDEQNTVVAFLPAGDTEIELVKPTDDETGVARFLKKHGPGLHHICFEVDDIVAYLDHLKDLGVRLINEEPIIGDLEQVTDGDKRGSDGSYVELGPGRQWVQVDLAANHKIHAIVLWHFHGEGRVYHDVVVQVADDPDFITNVRTLYNSDYDNSSGLGIGKHLEYFETYEGRLMPAKGMVARYVRLYSKGSTANDMNHYTEVEVYGKPIP